MYGVIRKIITFAFKYKITKILSMSGVIKIKKGLDIKLQGKAEKKLIEVTMPGSFAVKPPDFEGLTPKLLVKADHEVKAGTPLFFDKYNPDVKFTSPVSGKVASINRGERRRLLEVVIEPSAEQQFESFKAGNPAKMSVEEVKQNLLESGTWPLIRQRPYNVIANPNEAPKAVFITAFSTAPLAPDYSFIAEGEASAFQTGIDALAKLTAGKVHLSVPQGCTSEVFTKAAGVELHEFAGPHPAGNVGIQIHHLEPINKGDVVWTLSAPDVITIGKLFEKGQYDATKIVVVAGSEVNDPKYYKVLAGTSVKALFEGVSETDNRYISGDVLTGTQIEKDGYLGYYDKMLTVIPAGGEHEFLGWGMPNLDKFSISHTFLSWLTPNKAWRMDANMHGGHRPFVVTGEYDKVLPMDIMPVQLLKSILIEDIDAMEQLGIYEIAEEDFALCEVVCTSKTEVQRIVREGLDMVRKEFS